MQPHTLIVRGPVDPLEGAAMDSDVVEFFAVVMAVRQAAGSRDADGVEPYRHQRATP